MHCHGSKARSYEEVGHEIGMALRTAERNASLPTSFLELLKGISSARLGSDRGSQFIRVKLCIAPRNVAVVDLVGNAKVLKWTEVAGIYSKRDIGLEDQVLLAQTQQIGAVRPIGCCR